MIDPMVTKIAFAGYNYCQDYIKTIEIVNNIV